MSEFSDVTVIKKGNAYFDGKVTSRCVVFSDGTKKTLGFMLPGEYEFATGAAEIMEILSGKGEVLVKGDKDRQIYGDGDTFEVPANSSFVITVKELTDYCCSFIVE